VTLAIGGFVLLMQVVNLVLTMLGYSVVKLPYFLLFAPAMAIQFFRWWAIQRGWSAVTINELSASNLSEQLLGTSEEKLPPAVQSALVSKAQALGWMSWKDVLDAAREAGAETTRLHTSIFLGGHGSKIARPGHWKKAVDESAWRAGNLSHGLPAASHESPRPARF